jgi:hypothetical protein
VAQSLREALESAYGKSEETPEGQVEEVTPAPVTEAASTEPTEVEATPSTPAESAEEAPKEPKETVEAEKAPAGDRPRDPTGKFLRADKAKAAPTATKPPEVPVTGAKSATPVPKPAEATATKAPQSWRPQERDAWGKVPTEAQAAISRREAEIARTLQEVAPARQHYQQFQQVVGPYAGMIQAEGGDVLRTVGSLLQTAAALRTAPSTHKAGLVAKIISDFSVDPALVAQHLQGQAPQGQPQPVDTNSILQQAEERFAQRMQQQQLQSLAQHYAQKWESFAAEHEFAEDLKPTITKLIQAGVVENFDDAYAWAVARNPDVQGALSQREAAQKAKAAMASTQRAKAAASSLKSSPAGPTGGAPQPKDLRGTLEAAYEKASGHTR